METQTPYEGCLTADTQPRALEARVKRRGAPIKMAKIYKSFKF